jgi:hypothetical protein
MNGVVLPVNDLAADMFCNDPADSPGIPGFYYLWMRRDGNCFIGKLPPVNDFDPTAAPGTTQYRPYSTEVHALYTQADYVLIDVAVLWQFTGGAYWFDCVSHVGGSEHRFIDRYIPSTGTELIRPLIEGRTTAVAMGNLSTYQNNPMAIGVQDRSPGIPLGITRTALIGYWYSCDLNEGDFVQFYLSKSATRFAHPFATAYPSALRGFSHIKTYQISAAHPANLLFQDGDTVAVVLGDNGIIKREVILTGTPNIIAWYELIGFMWDRDKGTQKVFTT